MNYRIGTRTVFAHALRCAICLGMLLLLFPCLCGRAYAQDSSINPVGSLYTTDGEDGYLLSGEGARLTNGAREVNAGSLQVSGEISDIGLDDVIPAYGVSGSGIALTYQLNERLLDESAHLVSDSSSTVDSIALDAPVGLGALIVQTSSDGENWRTVSCESDVCADGTLTFTLPSPSTPELNAGCRVRVILAYRTGEKTGTVRRLFWTSDVYEYHRCTEIYDFRVYALQSVTSDSSVQTRTELGSTVHVESGDGYQGTADHSADDPHAGWELGHFSVAADSVTEDENGDTVFLVQSGEQAALYYTLLQNIDALHGDSALSVLDDTGGYDAALEASADRFGRGALVVRRTDADGTVNDPEVCSDFLSACAALNQDTCVLTLSEGDYEIALDYGIQSSRLQLFGFPLMQQCDYYRTVLRFSVRSADCPLTLIEHGSGQELASYASTQDGFYCSVNGAQYLELSVSRRVWDESESNLVYADFFSDVSGGVVFLGEGVYDITAHNPVTDVSAAAVIYVGSDPILQEYVASGCTASLSELRTSLTAQEDEEDGTSSSDETEAPAGSDDAVSEDNGASTASEPHASGASTLSTVLMILGTLTLLTGVVLLMYVSRRAKKLPPDDGQQKH